MISRVVLGDAILDDLPTSGGPVEICDFDGVVHGVYQPLQPGEYFSLEPDISEEEMERRAKLPVHGRTLSEITADWDKRK